VAQQRPNDDKLNRFFDVEQQQTATTYMSSPVDSSPSSTRSRGGSGNGSGSSSSGGGFKLFSGSGIKKNLTMLTGTGKAASKISPMLAHLTPSGKGDDGVDLSLLDVVGIDEFLQLLKSRTDSNSAALWHASCTLAGQLKGSRALLALGAYLASSEAPDRAFDRLLDTAHFLLNAEHVFVLQSDDADANANDANTGEQLVVTHARAAAAVGLRLPSAAVHDGAGSKVVNDAAVQGAASGGPTYVPVLEAKTGSKIRTLLSAPIVVDGAVAGAIVAVNKQRPHPLAYDTAAEPFATNDETLISFLASSAGLALKCARAPPGTRFHRGSSSSSSGSVGGSGDGNGGVVSVRGSEKFATAGDRDALMQVS